MVFGAGLKVFLPGREDVGNCSRCIFYRLKIVVHRLLVQARQLLAASEDLSPVDTGNKP